MGTRFEITSGRWAIAGFVGAVVLVIAAYVFAAGPIVSEIFTNVADDYCPQTANGEPDHEDSDCYINWEGVNHVEAWDRAHPSP